MHYVEVFMLTTCWNFYHDLFCISTDPILLTFSHENVLLQDLAMAVPLLYVECIQNDHHRTTFSLGLPLR
jgi:hypothetical protein